METSDDQLLVAEVKISITFSIIYKLLKCLAKFIGESYKKTLPLQNKTDETMATITLNYDARNVQAKKALEVILSMGFFAAERKIKKTGMEEALEDIEKGRVYRLITPKGRK